MRRRVSNWQHQIKKRLKKAIFTTGYAIRPEGPGKPPIPTLATRMRKVGRAPFIAFWNAVSIIDTKHLPIPRLMTRRAPSRKLIRKAFFAASHPAPPAPPVVTSAQPWKVFRRAIKPVIRKALFFAAGLHTGESPPPPPTGALPPKWNATRRSLPARIRKALFFSAGLHSGATPPPPEVGSLPKFQTRRYTYRDSARAFWQAIVNIHNPQAAPGTPGPILATTRLHSRRRKVKRFFSWGKVFAPVPRRDNPRQLPPTLATWRTMIFKPLRKALWIMPRPTAVTPVDRVVRFRTRRRSTFRKDIRKALFSGAWARIPRPASPRTLPPRLTLRKVVRTMTIRRAAFARVPQQEIVPVNTTMRTFRPKKAPKIFAVQRKARVWGFILQEPIAVPTQALVTFRRGDKTLKYNKRKGIQARFFPLFHTGQTGPIVVDSAYRPTIFPRRRGRSHSL